MFVAIPDKSTLVFLFFSVNLINLCKQRILWDTFHRCVDVMSPIQEMHQKSFVKMTLSFDLLPGGIVHVFLILWSVTKTFAVIPGRISSQLTEQSLI